MRALALLTLLGGCFALESDETTCEDHYVFDGPGLSNPYVVPINDQFYVGWSSWQVAGGNVYQAAIVDGSGQVVPGSEVDYGTERVSLVFAPLGRALYQRNPYNAGPGTYELRLATGELVATLNPSEIGHCVAFDGDAFLFIDGSSKARRVGLDGTIGAPFAVPQPIEPMYLDDVVVSEGVTWLVYHANDVIEVVRIKRGGGVLDSAPRRITDQALDHEVAAGARELAILTGNRQYAMTWHVLREDGTYTMKPLELTDHPGVRPWFGMTAEPAAYLAIFESGSLAARVTSDGVSSPPFAWPEQFTNAPAYGRGASRSMFVFQGRDPEGAPPTIRAMPIPFGAEPEPSSVVKTVEGVTRFEECGCNASGAAGGPLAIGLLGLVGRRRRRLAARGK